MTKKTINTSSFYLSWGCILLGMSVMLGGTYVTSTTGGLTSIFFLLGALLLGMGGLFFILAGVRKQ